MLQGAAVCQGALFIASKPDEVLINQKGVIQSYEAAVLLIRQQLSEMYGCNECAAQAKGKLKTTNNYSTK